MEYFFPITSLIIHNYKYIYYKSICAITYKKLIMDIPFIYGKLAEKS